MREEHELSSLRNKVAPVNYEMIYPFLRLKEEEFIDSKYQDEFNSFLYDIQSAKQMALEEAEATGEECTF